MLWACVVGMCNGYLQWAQSRTRAQIFRPPAIGQLLQVLVSYSYADVPLKAYTRLDDSPSVEFAALAYEETFATI